MAVRFVLLIIFSLDLASSVIALYSYRCVCPAFDNFASLLLTAQSCGNVIQVAGLL